MKHIHFLYIDKDDIAPIKSVMVNMYVMLMISCCMFGIIYLKSEFGIAISLCQFIMEDLLALLI